MADTSWRPKRPSDIALKVCRTGNDGIERVVWLGLAENLTAQGDVAHMRGSTVETLLSDLPLPYPPPGIGHSTDAAGFEYWWRQLIYIFDLPDPRLFPPIEPVLSATDQGVVERFIALSQALAASGAMGATCHVQVNHNVRTNEMRVVPTFPPLDVQAGFSVLLRQCENHGEPGSCDKVHNILWQAAGSLGTADGPEAHHQLRQWKNAIGAVRRKSVNQLLREQLVRREGLQALAYDEASSPKALLRRYNYGDLIHWGTGRDEIDSAEDELELAQQRFDFLEAALGIGHLIVGLGDLARAALTPRSSLLLP